MDSVGPRKHVLDGDSHWRNLANTTEPSVCGDDASLRQITDYLVYAACHAITTNRIFGDNSGKP